MKNLDILSKIDLFKGIKANELEKLLVCLNSRIVEYKKNQFIWIQGDTDIKIGIVLSGQVNIIKEDFAGNRNIITCINAPGLFGESLVCSEIAESPVSVQAVEDTKIMTIEFLMLIKMCISSCAFHTRLIQNMLKIIEKKNFSLNEKIYYLSKKTTKQKIASFLLSNISNKNDNIVKINFNRKELADYMGVNRSALSRELSKMRDKNIIDFKKNTFNIKDLDILTKISNE